MVPIRPWMMDDGSMKAASPPSRRIFLTWTGSPAPIGGRTPSWPRELGFVPETGVAGTPRGVAYDRPRCNGGEIDYEGGRDQADTRCPALEPGALLAWGDGGAATLGGVTS